MLYYINPHSIYRKFLHPIVKRGYSAHKTWEIQMPNPSVRTFIPLLIDRTVK